MRDKAPRSKKNIPEKRALELDHLDRTDDHNDAHYSWREVAKACDSSGGCSHE